MSYPNDAPAAAWYPDPQSPGRVRWWDGMNWTEHVSVPASPVTVEAVVAQGAFAQAAVEPAVPQIDEADVALAAADAEHAAAEHAAAESGQQLGYIGRHAAGASPAPRQAPRAPRIRPREQAEVPGDSLLSA